MTNKENQPMRILSLLLALAMVLPAMQPRVAVAQSNEGDNPVPAAIAEQDPDVGRYTTYAQVSSAATGEGTVAIEWTTAYETSNAGFNIAVADGDNLVIVNEELVPSTVIDSLEPQNYAVTVSLTGSEFYIEHVTVDGESYFAGPFTVGETLGEAVEPVETDWAAIRAESDALAKEREATRVVEINKMLDVVRGPAPSPDEPLIEQSAGVLGERSVFMPLVVGGNSNVQAADADAIDAVPGANVYLKVKEDGLYRVTYSDIAATGIDLAGVPSAYLALSNNGVPVRIRMMAAASGGWGSGAYFEFVGEGIDTLYTDENVYVLQVDRSKAFRTYRNLRAPDLTEAAPDYYRETIRFEGSTTFSYSSLADDPWVWGFGNATASEPKTETYSLTGINHLSSSGPLPHIETEVWTNTPYGHHMVVSINGTQVQDIQFVGETLQNIPTTLSNGILQNGANTLTWAMPGDTGATSDGMSFEAFTVEYSRNFVAQNGTLSFESDANLFTIDGLPNSQVTIFSTFRNRVWKMEEVKTEPSANGYTATFYGWGETADYIVVADSAVATPDIEAGQLPINITDGSYDFVIISHPDFISDLEGQYDLYDLIDARTAENYNVLLVDVQDIYAQFSHGIFNAQAIKDYIASANAQMGATYFLLVGSDQIDYRNYVYPNAISFIPSLYATAYPGEHYMPVDPLYADFNGDKVLDAPIGRFPVETTQELATVIQKTLTYSSQNRSALFTAGYDDGPNYTARSQTFASLLQANSHPDYNWQISDAYLDGSTVAVERQKIINTVNAGVGLVNYLGHSAIRKWGADLFKATDVPLLTNINKPTLLIQYGCYPSLYILPISAANPMSSTWMFSDNGGAAASLGAVGLTSVSSDVAIANEFSSRVAVPGKTIGMAVVESKQAVGYSSSTADVILGWILFGDPTLKVEP
ncbi:MAG: hypothetical protein H6642_15630 [Caldilineaceae bacterium]|nr:hypothetical protein [Caldilineaceae bacterium]